MNIQQNIPVDTETKPQRTHGSNIIIVGGSAAGKSTVGYQLAKIMSLGVVDIDALVSEKAQKDIASIFAEQGEAGFRKLERQVLDDLTGIQNHVIVAGGGLFEDEDNRSALSSLGKVVWLATPMSEILHRIVDRPEELRKRPLLADAALIEDREKRTQFIRDKLEEMMVRREPAFATADVAINCSYATADTCAQFIKLRINVS